MCVSESQAWEVDWKVEGGAFTTDKQNIIYRYMRMFIW
jgi:hypothetical protein